ncbi:hypothetical protein H8959_007646 [Pygathrix nigripes]
MGSSSSRVLVEEQGARAGGSAGRPDPGDPAAGYGFCYCPGSHKRSGAFRYCRPDSERDEDEEERDEQQPLLHIPVRKKLRSTSEYIYQTLFLNGENSDIKICALGEEWRLHKIYLCQSGYFSSMFSGSWKESSMNIIELEIPDQNIDVEALQVAFGSLYRDDVLIKPSRVVAILAAACMLQLDGLIQQCGKTMKETITVKTVCGYYTSVGTYGLDSVKKRCLEWLLNNLMTHQNVKLFKELSINVMKQLIGSCNLFVMQVEMDVYTALKMWMFLQLVPSWNGSLKQLLTETDVWFSKQRKDFEGRKIHCKMINQKLLSLSFHSQGGYVMLPRKYFYVSTVKDVYSWARILYVILLTKRLKQHFITEWPRLRPAERKTLNKKEFTQLQRHVNRV